MDTFSNFAYGTLASGITSSATTANLTTGHGARFPSSNFNVVIWNSTDYASPTLAYHAGAAEIVRVTSRSTDALTITRAQEGTTAVALNTSGKTYAVAQTFTKKTFDELAPLASPTFTGPITADGASIVPTYAITGGVVQTTKRRGVLALTGNQTLTFDATPPAANALFDALLHADGTDRTVTIPESKSFLRGGLITSFVVPANGSVLVSWYYTGSTLHIYGDPMTPAQVKSALAINFTDLAGTIALGQVPSGSALQVFRRNAANNALEFADAGAGSGDVVGPASATDGGLVLFDTTSGKLIKLAAGWSVNVAGELVYSADGIPGYVGLKDAHATTPKQLITTAPTALTTDQIYVEPATGGTAGQVKRVASVIGDVRAMEWYTPQSITSGTAAPAGGADGDIYLQYA